ncbi:growth arrest and DNA damage-inducible proteins-interacting protein 1-like [Sinocyclocheilus rhinocerous]|uniref:growth arrest and DNA damage-inducible proteins-interacting protein 1-like n=1 Tax=Sinocyclocheilus rhinocerous TaxID=307959 RepID=UPI0007B93EFE|nr:PREDICTED: growth arrest and DNA damage-inducible proteins-interacting protein 1-like [Sinocyclocheilus rhinocerous]
MALARARERRDGVCTNPEPPAPLCQSTIPAAIDGRCDESALREIRSTPTKIKLLSIAHYNPRPLWLNIKSPYIPSKESEKTPEWQKTEKCERRLFGRYGGASGVDPAKLWPSHVRLEELAAEDREWHPPIEVMLESIAAREREREKEQRRMER